MAKAERQPSTLAAENQARKQDKQEPEIEIEIVRHPAGIDLPVVGHVGYRSLALYGGLAAAGAVGMIEWPVAAAVGVAYALARR